MTALASLGLGAGAWPSPPDPDRRRRLSAVPVVTEGEAGFRERFRVGLKSNVEDVEE